MAPHLSVGADPHGRIHVQDHGRVGMRLHLGFQPQGSEDAGHRQWRETSSAKHAEGGRRAL